MEPQHAVAEQFRAHPVRHSREAPPWRWPAWRWLAVPFRAAAGLALLACLIVTPAPAHDRVGANLNFIGDYRGNHEFTDVVRQSRRFLKLGTYDDGQPANLAPTGADGWPTTDFRLVAMVDQGQTANLAGSYQVIFNGSATVAVAGGGAGSITASSHDAATDTTRATLAFPAGGANLMLDFTGTGGSVKNLRVLRPGTDAASVPTFTAAWQGHVQRFPILRFMDWMRTNGNRDVAWSDRVTPERRRTEAYGARWETVIEAANALGRDAWINVPVLASDDYVLQLATLLRDRLAPGRNVWVEYGNELWNFGLRDDALDALYGGTSFNGATVNRDLAAASPASSPLRYDGSTDATTLGYRRVALRLKEIADIFRGVWGAAAMNTRVRPVLAGQMANPYVVDEGLRLLETGLGVAPGTVLYALSGAPYIFAAAVPDGDADEVPGLTVTQILDGLAAGVANAPSTAAYHYQAHAVLAAWHGLKVVGYEGGFDSYGGGNLVDKRLANLDPRLRGICRSLFDQWHGHGFEHLLWYDVGADRYDTPFGMWPLVEDLAVPAVPKNQCVDDVLAAALPPVTLGTPVLGGAVAGGAFVDSAAPAGSLTGLEPAFGWPGYVEYLLRADAAGTYALVFTGQAPAGESFRVELNHALVAANVALPAASGPAVPIPVALRQGLNVMRIARAVGASWSVAALGFTAAESPAPQTVWLGASAVSVAEGAGSVNIAVTRSGSTGTVSVDYATADGTAVAGQDYVARSGTLTFNPGVTTLNAAVSIVDDSVAEGPETFRLVLSNPSPGLSLATPSSATVTITDNGDRNLEFESTAVSVGESAGSVTLRVRRVGPVGASASVKYATANGTAKSTTDYVARSGTLSWAAGDAGVKTIVVSLRPDTLREGPETFTVTLSSPSGATLGRARVATVTIVDDD